MCVKGNDSMECNMIVAGLIKYVALSIIDVHNGNVKRVESRPSAALNIFMIMLHNESGFAA